MQPMTILLENATTLRELIKVFKNSKKDRKIHCSIDFSDEEMSALLIKYIQTFKGSFDVLLRSIGNERFLQDVELEIDVLNGQLTEDYLEPKEF